MSVQYRKPVTTADSRFVRMAYRSREVEEMEQLPTIYCPFPSCLNPHVEAAHEHTLDWATRFRLIKDTTMCRFLASRFAWLTARVYPLAGLEELKLLNDWAVWLLLFDDQFDEGLIRGQPAYIQSLLDGYRSIFIQPAGTALQSPAVEALGDLVQRTFVQMPGDWRARFTRHFNSYFDTFIWSVNNCALGIIPEIDVYIEQRRHSGGMALAIDLIDLAEHIRLPASLIASPAFDVLARLTNDIVCWSNDIFSLEKEIVRGEVNNLVLVIAHAESLPLQEALDKASAMVSSAVQVFQQTERALPPPASELEEAIQKYLTALKSWMRGNLDWSAQTHRYSHVEPDVALAPERGEGQ